MTLRRIWWALCLILSFAVRSPAVDRVAELSEILADYEASQADFVARDVTLDGTGAAAIARYNSYPCWITLSRVLALIEADPTDAAASAASKWIVELTDQVGNQWTPIFAAEQVAWRIIKEQQLSEDEASHFCTVAARRQSPGREAFLLDLAGRTDLPGNTHAHATMALAEFLARRFELAEAGGFKSWWSPPPQNKEYFAYLTTQLDDEWIKYVSAVDAEPFRKESIRLSRKVLDQYADLPLDNSSRYSTFGQRAKQRLYALEHLLIGAQAPEVEGTDLEGNLLRLSDYRGKVVVLSFWFTGCGPCIGALPEEKELIQKYRDEPFALLGVARDDDIAVSKKTADEHGMTWPSWFDKYPGTIVEQFNVIGFPKFYLIDPEGRIVSKDVKRGQLANAVERVLHPQARSR